MKGNALGKHGSCDRCIVVSVPFTALNYESYDDLLLIIFDRWRCRETCERDGR